MLRLKVNVYVLNKFTSFNLNGRFIQLSNQTCQLCVPNQLTKANLTFQVGTPEVELYIPRGPD